MLVTGSRWHWPFIHRQQRAMLKLVNQEDVLTSFWPFGWHSNINRLRMSATPLSKCLACIPSAWRCGVISNPIHAVSPISHINRHKMLPSRNLMAVCSILVQQNTKVYLPLLVTTSPLTAPNPFSNNIQMMTKIFQSWWHQLKVSGLNPLTAYRLIHH